MKLPPLHYSILQVKKHTGLLLALLLLLVVPVAIQSCSAKQPNEAEKRIAGKWEQSGGTGTIAEMGARYEYSFGSENSFTMMARVAGQPLRSIRGTYAIINDSILFYYRDRPDEPYYSAKLVFDSRVKMTLSDANGQLEFSRK